MSQTVPFRYLAVSDQLVCPQPVPARTNRLFELGVDAVQIRDKTVDDRTRFNWLQQLDATDSSLLVNGRWDLAVLGGADGIHSPSKGLQPDLLRTLDNGDFIHGVSTHSREEVLEAEQTGADYVTYGPIYPTPSKPDLNETELPGIEGLARITDETDLPVLALGGVTVERVDECLRAGAYGVAGIRALFKPEDPSDAWSRINSVLADHTSEPR